MPLPDEICKALVPNKEELNFWFNSGGGGGGGRNIFFFCVVVVC